MSFQRKMQRSSPEARLAQRIGSAIEEYGRAGGKLQNVSSHLLRYAAQSFLMGNEGFVLAQTDFLRRAREAFDAELADIAEKAERGGKA